MRASFHLAREILQQPAFDPYRGRELFPGADVKSREDIDDFIRETAGSVYHLSGTCRMGTHVESVVDPRCMVHGVTGLRVVDASVMPQVTSGNTNAPTIMIAERAADLIKGLEPMREDDARYYRALDWETTQRPSPPRVRLDTTASNGTRASPRVQPTSTP